MQSLQALQTFTIVIFAFLAFNWLLIENINWFEFDNVNNLIYTVGSDMKVGKVTLAIFEWKIGEIEENCLIIYNC